MAAFVSFLPKKEKKRAITVTSIYPRHSGGRFYSFVYLHANTWVNCYLQLISTSPGSGLGPRDSRPLF